MNEINTSGDLRRALAQTIDDVRTGKLSTAKAQCIAQLSKEITSSIQAEVNVVKVKAVVLKEGGDIGKITHLGRMIIDGEDNDPLMPQID